MSRSTSRDNRGRNVDLSLPWGMDLHFSFVLVPPEGSDFSLVGKEITLRIQEEPPVSGVYLLEQDTGDGNISVDDLTITGVIPAADLVAAGMVEGGAYRFGVTIGEPIDGMRVQANLFLVDETGVEIAGRNTYELTLADIAVEINLSATGDKGDKGDTGDTGSQGLQGDPGDQGDVGDTGAQGIQGIQGDVGDTGAQGIQGVQGDVGDTGAQGIQGVPGDQGDVGDTGEQGIQGVQGDVGDTGAQGIQGVPGDQGDVGDTGEQGIPGPLPSGGTSADRLDGTGFWSDLDNDIASNAAVAANTAHAINLADPHGTKKSSFDYVEVSATTSNPTPYVRTLLDSSVDIVDIFLPAVTAGDRQWYVFTLQKNSKHSNIRVTGGSCLIGGFSEISMSTEKSHIVIVADGVDCYELLEDTRVYDRVIEVTGSISIPSGFESGGIYYGEPADGGAITITIANFNVLHVGDFAKFVKKSGENATFRVVSVDQEFDEVINDNDKGFTISVSPDGYILSQDSRPTASNIRITFYPTDNVSIFEPTYAGVLETATQGEEVVTTPAVVSSNPLIPDSLGFFINDNKALIGEIADTPITASGTVKLTSSFNRDLKIKFKYYEYDFGTNILNPIELTETSYSALIDDSAVFSEIVIAGTLPANTWATADFASEKLLVIELLAYKSLAGGDNPTLDFVSGGPNASSTYLAAPLSNVNHNTLGGVVPAAVGVPDGHINSSVPLQLPRLTTIERDAVASPVAGMQIYNDTTTQLEVYRDGSWESSGNTLDGNTQDDLLVWNATTEQYDPATPTDVKVVLGLSPEDSPKFRRLILNDTPGTTTHILKARGEFGASESILLQGSEMDAPAGSGLVFEGGVGAFGYGDIAINKLLISSLLAGWIVIKAPLTHSGINLGSDFTIRNTVKVVGIESILSGDADQLPTSAAIAAAIAAIGGSGLTATTTAIVPGDWTANAATKTVSGVTATNIVFPGPAPASVDDWATAGIIVTGQDTDELSFTCKITPTVSINVNITYQ